MNEVIKAYIDTYPETIQSMFCELRSLLMESVPFTITEAMWAKLPSYSVGDAFVRLIPFKDHLNIEAQAIPAHRDALTGYKLTPKGMLQVFVGQDVPVETLKLIFAETLGG